MKRAVRVIFLSVLALLLTPLIGYATSDQNAVVYQVQKTKKQVMEFTDYINNPSNEVSRYNAVSTVRESLSSLEDVQSHIQNEPEYNRRFIDVKSAVVSLSNYISPLTVSDANMPINLQFIQGYEPAKQRFYEASNVFIATSSQLSERKIQSEKSEQIKQKNRNITYIGLALLLPITFFAWANIRHKGQKHSGRRQVAILSCIPLVGVVVAIGAQNRAVPEQFIWLPVVVGVITLLVSLYLYRLSKK